ncbi:MAG: hypothetical protein M3O31_15855 [Acidobacteriota bacterium]|nr:hypothetical protein [Acidobacteriota bacterium]
MPTLLTVLSFITLFLAIFTPAVLLIRKLEQMDHRRFLRECRKKRERSESDSAWILNRRLMR